MVSRISFGCSSSKATSDDLPPGPILEAFGGTVAYASIPKLPLQDLVFEKTKGSLYMVHSFTQVEESLKTNSNPLGIFQAVIYKTKCKKKSESKATFIMIKVLDRMVRSSFQLQAILLQLPRKIYFCYSYDATQKITFSKQNFDKSLTVIKTLLNKGSLAHFPFQDGEYQRNVYIVTPNHALLNESTGRIVLYDFQQESDEKLDTEV